MKGGYVDCPWHAQVRMVGIRRRTVENRKYWRLWEETAASAISSLHFAFVRSQARVFAVIADPDVCFFAGSGMLVRAPPWGGSRGAVSQLGRCCLFSGRTDRQTASQRWGGSFTARWSWPLPSCGCSSTSSCCSTSASAINVTTRRSGPCCLRSGVSASLERLASWSFLSAFQIILPVPTDEIAGSEVLCFRSALLVSELASVILVFELCLSLGCSPWWN